MKQCQTCGKICQDSDRFCDGCGSVFPQITMQAPKKKSAVPLIIAGVGVLAAVMVVGTIFILQGMSDKSKNQEALASESLKNIEDMESQDFEVVKGADKDLQEHAEEEEADDMHDTVMQGGDAKEPGLDMDINSVFSETEEPQAEVQSNNSSNNASTSTYYVVNCNEFITLREKPSTKAAEICKIPLGSAVTYVEAAENGFYKISYNNQTGYSLASYLSVNQTSDVTSSAVTYMKVVHCKQSITLRKIPSTKGEEFCQIPLGEVVEFLGTAENGFYTVSYNGYTGYALASYLEEW